MRTMSGLAWVMTVAAAIALGGCSGGSGGGSGDVARGRELFRTPGALALNLRGYSCETCHDADASPASSPLKTGAPLAGVTLRPSFWNGQESDLLRALNVCRSEFMNSPEPLTAAEPDAAALYAFLASLEPGDARPAPFTVVREIGDVPRGDAAAGNTAYAGACAPCHGALHTGAGRLSDGIPILPEDTLLKHANYSPRDQRLVVIEKVRHGGFLGFAGEMPPFSTEVLDDQSLSDILELLGVLGPP